MTCKIQDELALNAIARAKTNECKAEIEHVACYYQQIAKKLDQYDMVRIKSRCPAANRIVHDTVICRLTMQELTNLIDKQSIKHKVLSKSKRLTHSLCNEICYTHFGYFYIAFHYDLSQYKQHMCVCLKNLTDVDLLSGRSKSCLTADAANTFQIYRTKFYGKEKFLSIFFLVFLFSLMIQLLITNI